MLDHGAITIPDHIGVTILAGRNGGGGRALTKREGSRFYLENIVSGERTMRPLFHSAALPCGLAVVAVVAIAVGSIGMRSGELWGAADIGDDGDVTGSIGIAARLPLSDEQRGHIFDGIMKVHDAPVADVAVPEPATALPRSVTLQELPASVTQDVPLVQGYKFVKLDDRILLVSPVDRTVVAEMPRYRILVD
ncbi:MAG TPA: DUF1236 domain-containing protein [Xanthobacteraceae bacterium]